MRRSFSKSAGILVLIFSLIRGLASTEGAQTNAEPPAPSIQKKMMQTINGIAAEEWARQNCLGRTLPPAGRKILVRFAQEKTPAQDPSNSHAMVYPVAIVFETPRPANSGQEASQETKTRASEEMPCLAKDGKQIYLRANALKWKINEAPTVRTEPVPKESARLHEKMKKEFDKNKEQIIAQEVKP